MQNALSACIMLVTFQLDPREIRGAARALGDGCKAVLEATQKMHSQHLQKCAG